ncbi:MAG: hypothetical protein ACPGEF_02500 [Endozoicomonas sp.]
MARISQSNNHQPVQNFKSNENSSSKKNKADKKISVQIDSTKPNKYLDKENPSVSSQKLSSRKVSPHNLNMLTSLAKNKKWTTLSDMIKLHSNTSYCITEIIKTIQKKDIQLPKHIQNIICLQFGRLSAITKAAVIKENLPKEPNSELNILSNYLGGYIRPDSPVGTISRHTIDNFIAEHQLEEVDRDAAVQQMSEMLYSIVLLRIQMLNELVIRQTVDKEIKEILVKSQNELRIELNNLQSIHSGV